MLCLHMSQRMGFLIQDSILNATPTSAGKMEYCYRDDTTSRSENYCIQFPQLINKFCLAQQKHWGKCFILCGKDEEVDVHTNALCVCVCSQESLPHQKTSGFLTPQTHPQSSLGQLLRVIPSPPSSSATKFMARLNTTTLTLSSRTPALLNITSKGSSQTLCTRFRLMLRTTLVWATQTHRLNWRLFQKLKVS